MKLKVFGAVCLSALALTWVTGCSAITDKAAEKATESMIEKTTGAKDVDIDKNGGSIKVKTDQGEAEFGTSEGKIPDGFPSDFPVYKSAKVIGNMKTSEGGKSNFVVTFETSDASAKVLDYYKSELPNSGYEISSSTEMGAGNAFMSLKKNGKDIGGVTIVEEKGKTNIMITLVK